MDDRDSEAFKDAVVYNLYCMFFLHRSMYIYQDHTNICNIEYGPAPNLCGPSALNSILVSDKMTFPNSQGQLQGHTSKASAGGDVDPKLSSWSSCKVWWGGFVGSSTPACEDAIFFRSAMFLSVS